VSAATPTMRPADAPATAWDAIVIGAGPAGAFTALQLARAGARTLLVDRKPFPRAKVCGGCVNARAVGILEAAGLGDEMRAAGARPVSAIELRTNNRHASLPLPPGLAITRATLDAIIVRAAIAAGAESICASGAVEPGEGPDAGVRSVRLTHPDGPPVTVSAKVVITADGLGNGALRDAEAFASTVDPTARIGVGVVAEPGTVPAAAGVITMIVAPDGYVGIAMVEHGRVNIAAALDPATLKAHGSPAAAVRAILATAGFAAGPALDTLDWQGTLPLTRRLSNIAGHRLFVLGDAAGYVEPFTGEGMAWALASAESLAPLALRAIAQWDASIPTTWQRTYDATVTQSQRSCRTVARALRHPSLVGAAVAALSHWPSLARPIVSRVALGRAGAPLGITR
jgi:flavin-dependent dehydrogenase